MTPSDARYYRSTGAVPLGGVFFAIGPTIAAAAVLAAVYAVIDWHNPFIYITFIATAGLGLGVGYTLQSCLRMGKVRNRTVAVVLSLVAGLFAVYAAWVVFLWVLIYDTDGVHVWLFNPSDVWMMIELLGANGLWQMGNTTPTGWFLYSFWIVEALMIGGLTVSTSLSKVMPFCETCNEWSLPTICAAYFALPQSPEELVRELEEENYEPLHDLTQRPYDMDDRVHVTVYECPGCDATWMSVDRVVLTTDKQGNVSSNETSIAENLIIAPEEGDLLKGLTNSGAGPNLNDLMAEHESDSEPTSDA